MTAREPLTLEAAARARRSILHPLAGSSLRHFVRLLRAHGGYSAASRAQRWISAAALLSRLPLAKLEEILHAKAIESHELSAPPVFVIGHWGSGTTFLHHLMSRDPNFGFLDFGHALMPWNTFETSAYLRFYIRPLLPKTRRFDDVSVGLEEPQEEEMALANMCGTSFFHTFYFPADIEAHTQRALFPETLDDAARAEFERAYVLLARRTSLRRGGQRLLFKNPASTTRIPLLRRLFPGAKFLHIVRNPYDVFAAALNRLPVLFSEFALQPFDRVPIESYLLDTFDAVMRRYLADRAAIPTADLHEMRFERLTTDPLEEIGKAYEALELPGWAGARPRIEEHLLGRPPCTRTPRQLDTRQIASVRERLAFAFDAWDYPADPVAAEIATEIES